MVTLLHFYDPPMFERNCYNKSFIEVDVVILEVADVIMLSTMSSDLSFLR